MEEKRWNGPVFVLLLCFVWWLTVGLFHWVVYLVCRKRIKGEVELKLMGNTKGKTSVCLLCAFVVVSLLSSCGTGRNFRAIGETAVNTVETDFSGYKLGRTAKDIIWSGSYPEDILSDLKLITGE